MDALTLNANDAMRFALEAMGVDRLDRGDMPYVRHLMAVASAVDRELGFLDDEAVQAAILHDVIEDTPVALEQLRAAGFSDRVVGLVDALTHRPGEDKLIYWQRILHHGQVARTIKAADARHNGSGQRAALAGLPPRRVDGYRALATAMENNDLQALGHAARLLGPAA